MADVQLSNGFTAIANELLEHVFLFPFAKVDLEVIFITIRFTDGYQKKESGIALNLFKRYIATDRANIEKSILRLIAAHVLIAQIPQKKRGPRNLTLNKNYEEWNRKLLSGSCKTNKHSRIKNSSESISPESISPESILSELSSPEQQPLLSNQQQLLLSDIQQSLLANPQQLLLSDTQQLLLSPAQQINKEENKIKINNDDDNYHNNHNHYTFKAKTRTIEYLITKEEMKMKEVHDVEIKIMNDLESRLIAVFSSCLGYEPNAYELESILKEITEDDRLTKLEILKIVQDVFHTVATYDKQRRNANYVINVIQANKQKLFLKKEEEKRLEEKRNEEKRKADKSTDANKTNDTNEEYIPGSILGPYYEAMARRSEELKVHTGDKGPITNNQQRITNNE